MEPLFAGTKTLQPFSPRWTDPELLEKTLVGRRELVDKLEQLVLEGAGGPNKYQRLIIGPRGSGKTHVLKVLHTRLWRNAEVKARLLVVYLLEDELGIASFLDFLVRVLKAIVAWYPENVELAKGLEALYDLPGAAQQRRAEELVLQAAGERDLLIIMENLGIAFDPIHGFGHKGQQSLRDLVQQNPKFMVFASAQALVDGVSSPSAPFYEFFSITHLKRLSFEEAFNLLVSVAAAYEKPEVTRFLGTAEGRSRVRAIYDFTGGNHRLLVTFYDFLSADSLGKVSDAFLDALKPLKPYYQEQMRALSAQQQKIVQYLSIERTPRTVKEIARGCLSTSNTVSSQLKILLTKGFVDRIQHGRESYYEIAETLFRICYEADLDHQGAPVRLFIDFLGNFYTAQELETRARGFQLLARALSEEAPAHEGEASFYRQALERYHKQAFEDAANDGNIRDELHSFFRGLSDRQSYEDVISFARRLGGSKDSTIALVEADAHVRRGNLDDACIVVQKEVDQHPDDAALHSTLGALLLETGEKANAEACCRRSLELDPLNEHARRTLVAVLSETNRHQEALVEFGHLADDSRATSSEDLALFASLHRALGHDREAEDAWRMVLRIDPSKGEVREKLALHLASTGRFEESLVEFDALLAVDPTKVNARAGRGFSFFEMGRAADAERDFRAALKHDPAHQLSLFALGMSLNETKHPEEVLTHLQRLTPPLSNRADVWRAMGKAHQTLGQHEEAIVSLKRALELEFTEGTVTQLVRLLMGQERWLDAEALLIDLQGKLNDKRRLASLALVYSNTGQWAKCLEQTALLQQLEPAQVRNYLLGSAAAYQANRLVEAESNLRKAVKLDQQSGPSLTPEQSAYMWATLGMLLSKTNRPDEAADALRRATAIFPENGIIWGCLGPAFRTIGDFISAEEALRRAVLLKAPDSVRELARFLEERGRAAEAEPLLRNLIEAEPGNAEALFGLARVLLPQGKVSEASEMAVTAINADTAGENLAERLRSNLASLFLTCTQSQMGTYLVPVMNALSEQGRLIAFEQALSLVVFELLKKHEEVSEDRLTDMIWCLEHVVGDWLNISVAALILRTGIDYFKRQDSRALMNLSREERDLFTKELIRDAE